MVPKQVGGLPLSEEAGILLSARMAGSGERRIFGLDLLRAAAIGSVVLAHGGLQFVLFSVVPQLVPAIKPYVGWSTLVAHGGVIGVELFFVLSGFLIGGILLHSADELGTSRGLLKFYVRRWFRTLPLFAVALAANVIFERLFHDRTLTGAEITGHGLFLRNFSALRMTFFPESWSLAVEEWFYLLFPAVLWAGLRLTRARFDRVFVVCAAVFFVFSATARTLNAFQPDAAWGLAQRCIVIFRFDALMTGVIAAWLALRWPEAWRRAASVCLVAGLIGFCATYASFWTFSIGGVADAGDSFFARTFRFNLLSLSFALLLPFASVWVPRRETIAHTTARKIALWSYALYLVHWPLFQIFNGARFEAWQQTWDRTLAIYGAKVLMAVAIAVALHYAWEVPWMRLRERITRGR
jgi:peptidoglycan/LPS O-acetylase OafA/YrhL